jgi:hypothetical protein
VNYRKPLVRSRVAWQAMEILTMIGTALLFSYLT